MNNFNNTKNPTSMEMGWMIFLKMTDRSSFYYQKVNTISQSLTLSVADSQAEQRYQLVTRQQSQSK